MNTLSRDGDTPPTPFLNLSISKGFLFPCAVTRKVVLLVSMKANYFSLSSVYSRVDVCVQV